MSEWSELSDHSAIFSMQGRRPGNEDRAVIRRVETVEGMEESDDDVTIWAVMDGHGGHVSSQIIQGEYGTNIERLLEVLESSLSVF